MPDDSPASPAQVRAAIDGLKTALEAHLAAVESRAGENDPHVQAAYDALASAAETYDDALFSAYEEVTPFGPVEADDDSDDETVDEADEDDDDEDDADDDADDDELEWDEPEGQ